MASTTNSAGNMIQYSYNTGNGTLTSLTAGEQNPVGYTYNAMRALAGVAQTVSNLSSGAALTNNYEYENDRLTDISAANTVEYSFEYDLWGNQTSVKVGTQPLAQYTYGTGKNYGRTESVAFGNGQTITFSYDSYNNVTGISYDEGTTWSYTYVYSSTNGLVSASDHVSNQITYFTDAGYEIYTLVQTGQGDLLYSSSYDEDDNFVQTIKSNADTFAYTFAEGVAETPDEADDRRTTGLTVKRSTISSAGTSLALSSSTDFFGRAVNSTFGVKDGANDLGSVAVEYTYQGGTGNQTTEFVSSYKNVVTPTTGSATNVEYTYTYDANGNISSDSLGGVLKHSYVYDEAGQLVRVNDAVQNRTFCYAYDNGGNLTSKKRYAYTTGDTLGSVQQTWTYAYGDSNWKDKLTSYNGIPLSYDSIGNLTHFGGYSYTWTAGRQLENCVIDQVDIDCIIEYKYNADGLRTQKKITDDENWYYVTYDYIWADGKLVSQTDGTDTIYFLYDDNDRPFGFVLNDAATYLYIKNLQGDITGIANENGAVIVNYTYDEWGKPISTTGNGAGTIGAQNPLRYRGYYYDDDTGLYYLQSRYYNPTWGRFINADVYCHTETGVIGTNMYAYCDNSPVNMYDPLGLFKKAFHYDRTLEIAIAALFKEIYAKRIAYGCNDIDKRYSPIHRSRFLQSWHFNVNMIWDNRTRMLIADPNLPDSRDSRGNEAMMTAKEYLAKANRFPVGSRSGELEEVFYWFGAYLHTQQDKISHSGPYGNMAVMFGTSPLFFYHPAGMGIDDPNRKYLSTGYTTGEAATLVTVLAMISFKLFIKGQYPSIYNEILR